jgi:hypothetical protein
LLIAGVESEDVRAQFSPGDLSKAHQQLEGVNNCLQCHETGNEISGKKCTACHAEIQNVINAKHGFHFRNAAKSCVECHKEHLGRSAQAVQFNDRTFDHALTGFTRTGKHATIECDDCHAKKSIADAAVLKIVNEKGRATYLGLSATCVSCHRDKHDATVGTDCKSCHTTEKWSPVAKTFDHAKTEFALVGKHATVVCSKCHTTMAARAKDTPLVFATKAFRDCAPCHASPHHPEFVKAQACKSCHAPEDWKSAKMSGKFNHDLTAFKLIGRHEAVACEKCHKGGTKSSVGKSLKLAHNRCSDCHADYHKGEFAQRFNGTCENCHTPFGFAPATFTFVMHNQGRFALTGAHVATPCEKCHARNAEGRKVFHFASTHCESCHKDKHGGQFAKEMTKQSCAACHSTADWFPKSFDHSKTSFPLVGKHAKVSCETCHTPKVIGGNQTAQYKGTTTTCQSCHEDVHAAQFSRKAEGGKFIGSAETACVSCHKPDGWKQLVFDHNRQSVFQLTGGHLRVECRECHREERRAEKAFVRYKPMSTKCESCHA